MRLSSGKVNPATLLKERSLNWVRPALLPCQRVQPCPEGHKISIPFILPRAGSFSMQWGCSGYVSLGLVTASTSFPSKSRSMPWGGQLQHYPWGRASVFP